MSIALASSDLTGRSRNTPWHCNTGRAQNDGVLAQDPSPRSRFYDAAARWGEGEGHEVIIDAATQALVDDLDSPALRTLAGLTADLRRDEIAPGRRHRHHLACTSEVSCAGTDGFAYANPSVPDRAAVPIRRDLCRGAAGFAVQPTAARSPSKASAIRFISRSTMPLPAAT